MGPPAKQPPFVLQVSAFILNRRIACPTLLVTGDEDPVSPPQAVRAIGERIPGAQLEVLSRCGHWTIYEKPEECSELLGRFFSQRFQ